MMIDKNKVKGEDDAMEDYREDREEDLRISDYLGWVDKELYKCEILKNVYLYRFRYMRIYSGILNTGNNSQNAVTPLAIS